MEERIASFRPGTRLQADKCVKPAFHTDFIKKSAR
jgi:hypothetical protein